MTGRSAGAAAALLLGLAAAAAGQEESPVGYIEMPESSDGTWVLTHGPGSGRAWGRPVFVRYLVMVATEWKRRHPDGPVLRIGDMSKPDGSNFPPHKTHKDGLTADLFTSPRNVCHVDWDDQELTLELARLLHDLGARQILYNGRLVIDEVPIAQRWPKHDDHFHIVIDPSRVPEEGQALILPGPGLKGGAFVPATALDEDGAELELTWRVLGSVRMRHFRVLVDDDADPRNGVLHDSEAQRGRDPSYELPIALEDGRTYRWRVELVTGEEESVAMDWQAFTVDLTPPEVEALWPGEEVELSAPPVLTWRYRKPGVPQASYRIELDTDRSHRRTAGTLGPFTGAEPRHPIAPDVPLRGGKHYYWRVIVTDAHGNEAASEWLDFETGHDYDREAPAVRGAAGDADTSGGAGRRGVVTASALNLRRGPGTGHGVITALPGGTEVRILSESRGWLRVEAEKGGRPFTGWVSGRYIDER